MCSETAPSDDTQWVTPKIILVAGRAAASYVFSYYERRQIVPASDAIREAFLDLISTDSTFDDYIGRTTDKPDRVRYRAETWKKRIDALVTVPPSELRLFSRQLKMQLYESDPTCELCGQHIQSADDAEVDHVVNYWRGGRTSSDNARLAHRYCNRVRGGREDNLSATVSV
jgi:hypothetical protein